MLIPYQVDVPMARWPVCNFALIAAITLVSLALVFDPQLTVDHPLVLNGWNWHGMLGHIFVHGGLIHLAGNMIFLWVFGNAVCAKIGNLAYLAAFLVLGAIAAAAHNAFDGSPAVGASGAINGIVGMYLIFYPLNDVRCFWVFALRAGTFEVSSIWMILLWLVFDIAGVVLGGEGVAYWAHLGGFAAGVGLAAAMLQVRWVEMSPVERSLLDVMAGRA